MIPNDTESSLFDYGEAIKFAVKGMAGVMAPFGVVQPLQHEGRGVRCMSCLLVSKLEIERNRELIWSCSELQC